MAKTRGNWCGWFTLKVLGMRSGSTIAGGGASAFGSVLCSPQPEKTSRARHSSKAADQRMRAAESFGAETGGRAETAPQEPADGTALAALEVKEDLAVDVMGSPPGPRPDSIELPR